MIAHLPFNPTPITVMPFFSKELGIQLFCKRDDLFEKAGGGSKARMLQYIMSDINSDNCDVFVTAGGPCSNFNRACALMCGELGIGMHLVEYTDEPDEYQTALNSYLTNIAGIEKTKCDRSCVADTIKRIEDNLDSLGLRHRFVYAGGKSLEGFYSYYKAVEEVSKQIDTIDHLFVACGTGTTLTGICAGMQKFFPDAQVHAVSAARQFDAEMPVLKEDMNQLNSYLGTNYGFENLHFYTDFLCGGYAQYNEELLNMIRLCLSKEGVIIDPTYSGKAFWGMNVIIKNNRELFRDKNILFWNTGGLFNLLSVHCEELYKSRI